MTKSSLILAAVVLALATPIVLVQRNENARLKDEAHRLQTSLDQERRLRARGESSRDGALRNARSSRSSGRHSSPESLRELLEYGSPLERTKALLEFAEHATIDDIPEILKILQNLGQEGDPDVRMLRHILLSKWAAADPEGALASLKGLSMKEGDRIVSVLSGIAAANPERAAEWLTDPNNKWANMSWMGSRFATTIARSWVKQDTDGVLAWAATLPPKLQAGAYSGALGVLASSDPKRASELAAKMEAGEARRQVVGEIAEVWALTEPKAAAAWAESLEGGDRQSALRNTLESWAQREPSKAAEFLTGREDVDEFMTVVVGNWAQQEPANAARWLAEQPEGKGRNQAFGHVSWNWTMQNADEAAAWLGEMPEGEARDHGITGLAKAAMDLDPESAVTWAASMSNEERRNSMVQHGLRQWQRTEPERAQNWARENNVDMPSVGGKGGYRDK